MTKYIAINTHSFVDVITNSSTEIFVCDTDKTIITIKEILKSMLEEYNSSHSTNLTYDNCFLEPYIYTKELHQKHEEGGAYWRYESIHTIGKIIIEGCSDNSVPYDLFDEIEDVFNAYSEHLG